MLISFSVENWMSFKERVEFSMVASREKQHKESLFAAKYSPTLLPIAAVYGGNAAGKTNFFKALSFVRNIVLVGTNIGGMIQTIPFKLSKDTLSKPSKFSITILVDKIIYEYSISLTNRKVLDEKLVKIVKKSRRFDEEIMYNRRENDADPHLSSTISESDLARLRVVFEGTRANTLFLTNSVSLQIETFKPVYDWFLHNIELIGPDTRFEPFDQFIDENSPIYEDMNKLLPQFDTSINSLCSEDIPFDSVQFPDPRLKQLISEVLKENEPRKVRLHDGPVIFERNGDSIIARKLTTMHKTQEGENIRFDVKQESDGSQRMIDLLPAFLKLSSMDSQKVYIIDEIDRSLHSLLTRSLVEMYLSACNSSTKKQLIFTTHDVFLMDQTLLRRDEMWITERNENSESSLFSLCEYKGLRDDTDLKRQYLDGKLGGIPVILKSGIMKTVHAKVLPKDNSENRDD